MCAENSVRGRLDLPDSRFPRLAPSVLDSALGTYRPPPAGPRRHAGICFGGAAVDGEGRCVRRGALGGLRPASVSHARNPATPAKDVSELGPVKTVSQPICEKGR